MNQLVSTPPELLLDLRHDARRAANSAGGLGPVASTPPYVQYWRAVMFRKWSIAALVLLVTSVTLFVVLQLSPVYRASATVLLETSKAKLVSVEEVYSGVSANREHFQTQAEVIKSRDVAARVIARLNLASHPEFDPRVDRRSELQKWVERQVPEFYAAVFGPRAPLAEEDVEAVVLRRFAERLSVDPVRNSQLVRVRFEAGSPALAANVANAVAGAYIQTDIESRAKITEGANSWISERLLDLKKKLEASERALQAYRDREGLLDSKSTVLSGTGRQLDEFTQRLVDARVRRAMAEEAYNEIRAGEANNFQSVPAVVRATSVQQAQAVQNDAEKRFAEVAGRYGPDHPRHVAAKSEVATARENTQREIRVIIDSVLRDLNAARATEKTIEAALEKSKGAIQKLNRKEIELAQLEREAATNRQLYDTFLVRHKETTATRDAQQANARVVDVATPPAVPVRPNKSLSVALAAGLSMFAGVFGALLLGALNNSVKTTSDVEEKLGQPLLAALPQLTGAQRLSVARALVDEPQGIYAEAVRTAATSIMLATLDVAQKVLVVTSSVPGEGKSTFALSLALSQAPLKKVLLLEADLRRPSVAKALGQSYAAPGLSDLLLGTTTVDESLIKVDGSELSIILAGTGAPHPLHLFGSERFADLLRELKTRFDLIVIDTPPVQLVSDALVIGRYGTGTIYVVRADETPVPLACTGVRRTIAAQIPLLGVVLNQQNFRLAEKYYGETYGYGRYGYGKPYGSAA